MLATNIGNQNRLAKINVPNRISSLPGMLIRLRPNHLVKYQIKIRVLTAKHGLLPLTDTKPNNRQIKPVNSCLSQILSSRVQTINQTFSQPICQDRANGVFGGNTKKKRHIQAATVSSVKGLKESNNKLRIIRTRTQIVRLRLRLNWSNINLQLIKINLLRCN